LLCSAPAFTVYTKFGIEPENCKFNWFNIKDATKYNLILSYMKKADNKKRKTAINDFLRASIVSKAENQKSH